MHIHLSRGDFYNTPLSQARLIASFCVQVAHVGLGQAAAEAKLGKDAVACVVRQLRDMDRAICEGVCLNRYP